LSGAVSASAKMSSDSKKDKESGSYSSGDERPDKKDKGKEQLSSSDPHGRDNSKEEKRRQKIQKIIEKEAWPARHTNKLPFKKRAALIHHGDPVMMFNVVKTNAYGKRQKRFVSDRPTTEPFFLFFFFLFFRNGSRDSARPVRARIGFLPLGHSELCPGRMVHVF
jgi:hypothetical protein